MKSTIKVFGIIALVTLIGFSLITCDNGSIDDNNGGGGVGGNGNWRIKKYTSHTVTGGAPSSNFEAVYNWITYRYTNDTHTVEVLSDSTTELVTHSV